jgi:hypothetical protein
VRRCSPSRRPCRRIFQTGDRILAATADAAAISAALPLRRVAVLGSVTVNYLSRGGACGILIEGTTLTLYQAPFGAYIQDILDPTS